VSDMANKLLQKKNKNSYQTASQSEQGAAHMFVMITATLSDVRPCTGAGPRADVGTNIVFMST